MVFSVAGIVKMTWNWKHTGYPVPLSVDFRGGTEVQIQFQNRPDLTAIRQAVDAAGFGDAPISNYDDPAKNEVLISLPEQKNENSLDDGRKAVESALQAHYNNYFNPANGVNV